MRYSSLKSLLFFLFLISVFHSVASGGQYYVPLYWISTSGANSSQMISTSPGSAAYGSSPSIAATFGPLYHDYPVIYSRTPPNNYVSSTGNENLTCRAGDGDWLKNITFYTNISGSWQVLGHYNLTAYIDEESQNITFNDTFYWYCYVCDALGYCTNTTPWVVYYNASIPFVELIEPANDTYQSPSTTTFSCNATDNVENLDTITIYIWRNGTLFYTNTTSASGHYYQANFTLYTDLGEYNWTCKANNSKGYEGWAGYNYTLHVVSSNTPTIIEAWARPPVIINGTTEWLFINATNSDYVYANVTLPNGSIEHVNLTNGANTSYNNTYLFGQYNVTFVAENTISGTYATAYDEFIVVNGITFNLSVVNSSYNGTWARLEIVYDEWTYVNQTSANGNFSINLPNYTFNTTITSVSGNSIAFFEMLHLGNDNNKIFGNDREDGNESILYGYDERFSTPTSVTLRLSYGPLSLPLSSILCSAFNFSQMNCSSGTGLSPSIAGGYLVFSFSSLGEDGIKILQEEESGGGGKKHLNVELDYTGCLEDGVTFIITDRSSGEPVDARVYVLYDVIWNTVEYGSEVTVYPPYEGEYFYNIRADGYVQEDGHFTLEKCNECEDSSECGADEVCSGGQCEKIDCDCGYIEDHSCIHYECCSNDDCSGSSYCSSENTCEPVECACGYIENHTCISYECCSDDDCSSGEICEDHVCNPLDIEIIAPNETDEGDNVTVQLLINGEPGDFEDLLIEGESYTTDEEGYVTFIAPPVDEITVIYRGRVQKIKVIPVNKILDVEIEVESGEFFKDVPVDVELFDSQGNPISANIEIVSPTGETSVYYDVHKIKYVPSTRGKYLVRAFGKGYIPSSEDFRANSCELSFFGNIIDFGRWSLVITLCWYIWLLVLIILSLLYYIYRRLKKRVPEKERYKRRGNDEEGYHEA